MHECVRCTQYKYERVTITIYNTYIFHCVQKFSEKYYKNVTSILKLNEYKVYLKCCMLLLPLPSFFSFTQTPSLLTTFKMDSSFINPPNFLLKIEAGSQTCKETFVITKQVRNLNFSFRQRQKAQLKKKSASDDRDADQEMEI